MKITIELDDTMLSALGESFGRQVAALAVSRRLAAVGSVSVLASDFVTHATMQSVVRQVPARTWQRNVLLAAMRRGLASYGSSRLPFQTWLKHVREEDRKRGWETRYTPLQPGRFLRLKPLAA